MGMAQAVDIRGEELVSPTLHAYYTKLRAHVAPLMDDRRMDNDINALKSLLFEGAFA